MLAMTQPLKTMEKGSEPAGDKEPCPNCWTRTYKGKNGNEGRVFTTTSGASEDILDEGFRRMLVNACMWAVGMEDKIKPESNVEFVGKYNPSTFQMNSNYFVGVKPSELAGWDSPIMPGSSTQRTSTSQEKTKPEKICGKKTDNKSANTAAKTTSSRRMTSIKPAAIPTPGTALNIELG